MARVRYYDLRGSKYPMDDTDELFSIFAYFIKEARKIKNCYVILSTILPSVENQENCDVHFHEFDEGQNISEYFFLFLQKSNNKKLSLASKKGENWKIKGTLLDQIAPH